MNGFSQDHVWNSLDHQISIRYNENWRFTQPNDVMIARFMPTNEYPDGKSTSISLIVGKKDSAINTLEDVKDFMRGYVSNFENGKLVSFENIKEGEKDILVTTISLTRESVPIIYKSYFFMSRSKNYNLMLLSNKGDFEQNEVILKEMYKTLIIK